ncbi:MAG: hypothetical protein KGM98_14925 [Bacteroidota bacterium]|nr:hypothetical protein [Bacteroidota bacterium]
MKYKMLFIIIVLHHSYAHSQNTHSPSSVQPKHFKIIMPLEMSNRGIMIPTYWGANKVKVDLLWDNNSPTWANKKVIQIGKSIKNSKGYFYSTSTADGTPIHGNIYTCDSICIKGVTFLNIPFYCIHDPNLGAFGDNLISKGIWEINFKEKKIIFASDIDSLPDIKNAEVLPTSFTNNIIKLLIQFRNNIAEEVQVDFGFNGSTMVPEKDFRKLSKGNYQTYNRNLRFSTPTNIDTLETNFSFDTIQIEKHKFKTFISSNKVAREKLMGLGFFRQFNFVILDFLNKAFYLSRQ